jgi:hypothetical protein
VQRLNAGGADMKTVILELQDWYHSDRFDTMKKEWINLFLNA